MDPVFVDQADAPINVHVFSTVSWPEHALTATQAAFAEANGFTGAAGQIIILPNPEGQIADVLFGLGNGTDGLALAALSAGLPEGDYALAQLPETYPKAWAYAGWHDGAYRFDRYRKSTGPGPRLVVSAEESSGAGDLFPAIRVLRDLVNTPAEDLGPDGLQAALSSLAEDTGAKLEVTMGEALLAANYPMIHAVGRAAAIAPRFLELTWGNPKHPELALIGKGVVFDTGGLNIKTGDFMRLMKKDMGGAAHAIALAKLVIETNLPVYLKLYVPAVENAVSGNAFRPGDVIPTRKGLNVEIDNTDAEGRLILCEALTRAQEGNPDLIMDFATLTGAARVALGPDLAPFYTDNHTVAADLVAASETSGDPVWQMPLWRPYRSMLKSSIADIVNSGGRMAGSITAAIYLAEFVETEDWVHFDIWAWREARYGRPAGAAATGLRAAWAMLEARYRS